MDIDYSRMKGESGHYLTQGLFYEFRFQTKLTTSPYTLREEDYKGYISMYRLYMSCDTEYEAAILTLNSWKHWQIICRCSWFMEKLEAWRKEREIRDEALAKSVLIKEAEKGNVTAAKAIIGDDKRNKAGRPTKAEVNAEKKKQASEQGKVTSILERMNKI